MDNDEIKAAQLDELIAHCDGKDCTCLAYGECECACDADWTPSEVYRLRHELAALQARCEVLEASHSEWIEKTEWVQKDAKPKELGRHRADVLRSRCEAAEREAAIGRDITAAMLPVFDAMRPLVLNLERLKDAARGCCHE